MSKSRTLANDWLKLLYKGTAIANVADNAGDSPLTDIQVALHTAWPGETATQDASEVAYTGYGRVAVARGAGWNVTDDSVSPAAAITFGPCTGAPTTAYFWSTGEGASGATKIWHRGVVGSRLGVFVAATNDNITIPGISGVSVDDRIVFFPTHGGSLPTGITEGVVYWVKTVAGEVVTVSTTQGGTTLDITAIGSGVAYKCTPLVITAAPEVTPSLGTGSTIVEE